MSDSDELYEMFSHSQTTKHLFENLDEDQKSQVKVALSKEFEEKYSWSTSKPLEWEVLICIAKK